jgi:hypothetical protein
MPKIYVPATSAEQWAQLLADPEKTLATRLLGASHRLFVARD